MGFPNCVNHGILGIRILLESEFEIGLKLANLEADFEVIRQLT